MNSSEVIVSSVIAEQKIEEGIEEDVKLAYEKQRDHILEKENKKDYYFIENERVKIKIILPLI